MSGSQPGPAVLRYVIQAKNARGKALGLLIDQALSAPDLFVFGELLELPSVQQLQGTPEAGSLELLQLFAHGTYDDYLANAERLPTLRPEQLKKLRKLTIVSLAHTKKTLPYAELLAAVRVDTLRELEDLVIDAIYAGLLAGKLDQKRQHFTVDFAMGRDLREGDLEHMISLFDSWASNCDLLLEQMDAEMKRANAAKAKDATREQQIQARIDKIRESVSADDKMMGDGATKAGGGDMTPMDFSGMVPMM
eukprot:m.190545 g.190545  ORF g.190545 m.190545 type:complete len:250 (-) comp18051_c0_seq1:38-787(-)